MKRVIAMGLCLCFLFCGCSEDASSKTDGNHWFPKETQTEEPGFVPDEVPDMDVDGWYYDSLALEEERETYRQILEAIQTLHTEEVHLTLQDPDRITELYQYILYDNPELFWVDTYELYTYQLLNTVVGYGFKGNYTVTADELPQLQANLEAKADAILEEAPIDGDEYTKAKFVYESVIRGTEYDMAAPDNQNIRSVLENGASVCQGYALTVQYLLDQLGVKSVTVSGTADGVAHAWNIVWIDEEAYCMDATWGDPQFEDPQEERPKDYVSYDYMLITMQELEDTHVPDMLFPLPECTATAANYYVREGLYVENWDPEHFQMLMNRSLLDGSGEWTMRCADDALYQQLYEMLLEEQGIYPYIAQAKKDTGCAVDTERIQYSLDESNYQIQFQLILQ